MIRYIAAVTLAVIALTLVITFARSQTPTTIDCPNLGTITQPEFYNHQGDCVVRQLEPLPTSRAQLQAQIRDYSCKLNVASREGSAGPWPSDPCP